MYVEIENSNNTQNTQNNGTFMVFTNEDTKEVFGMGVCEETVSDVTSYIEGYVDHMMETYEDVERFKVDVYQCYVDEDGNVVKDDNENVIPNLTNSGNETDYIHTFEFSKSDNGFTE